MYSRYSGSGREGVVSEPDPSHGEEEGSGHHLTFELSPGPNVDVTNPTLPPPRAKALVPRLGRMLICTTHAATGQVHPPPTKRESG